MTLLIARIWKTAALGAVLAGCLPAVIPAVVAADPGGSASTAQSVVTLGDDSLFAGIPGAGPLTAGQIKTWLADPANHRELQYQLPKGLDAAQANIFVPEDNPITLAKIELGRQLFLDPRLSSDAKVSCASCHDPSHGFAAPTQFGVGVSGQTGGRNSPVGYNRILSHEQFWDGRAATLEDQAVGPIANPIEMGNTHEGCVACLAAIPGYQMQFDAIFPKEGLSIETIGKALATFERAIVTGPTPYDYLQPVEQFRQVFGAALEDLEGLRQDNPELVARYEQLVAASEQHPMSDSAKNGMKLFADKAQCATCHAGANFTDEQYHNLGVGMEAAEPDLGRYVITKQEIHKGAFKTPTLRSVAASPPYMHDGSQKTLEEVVEWYDKGGHPNAWLSDKMKKLDLTEQEKADLVAFMKEGLSGRFPTIQSGRLPQ